MPKAKRSAQAVTREIVEGTREDRRWVKRLRKLGASNYEIAQALGIKEDSPLLKE